MDGYPAWEVGSPNFPLEVKRSLGFSIRGMTRRLERTDSFLIFLKSIIHIDIRLLSITDVG